MTDKVLTTCSDKSQLTKQRACTGLGDEACALSLLAVTGLLIVRVDPIKGFPRLCAEDTCRTFSHPLCLRHTVSCRHRSMAVGMPY